MSTITIIQNYLDMFKRGSSRVLISANCYCIIFEIKRQVWWRSFFAHNLFSCQQILLYICWSICWHHWK